MTLDAVLGAPRAAQAAAEALPKLAERFFLIREARRRLVSFHPPRMDVEYDLFSEFKNAHLVHPHFNRRPVSTPPWPEGGVDHLVWLATNSNPVPEPWLPTGAQQDRQFEVVFAEALARQRHAADTRAKVAAWGAARPKPSPPLGNEDDGRSAGPS